jgi:DNA-binding NarL/FixJ family response regulator
MLCRGGDPVRVIIVEDVLLVRDGLEHLLGERGVETVASLSSVDHLADDVRRLAPDVVILDIRLPPTFTDEGLRAATDLQQSGLGVGVLVLSQHLETAYAWHLIEESPSRIGYLLKDRVSDISVIVDALHRLAAGETVIDPEIVARLLGRRRRTDPLAGLSEREREVLAMAAEGLSNRAIGVRLYVGDRTVETHISSAFVKLGIENSADINRRVRVVLAWLRAQ